MGADQQIPDHDEDEAIFLEFNPDNTQVLDRAYLIAMKPEIRYILSQTHRSLAMSTLATLWIKKDQDGCTLETLFRADILKRLLDGESVSLQESDACVEAVKDESRGYAFSKDAPAITAAIIHALAKLGIDELITEAPPESASEPAEPLA